MKFKNILVITYGRSGSTLLQGLLNVIDGCVIRGENHDFCYGLFRAWQSLCSTHQKGQADLQLKQERYRPTSTTSPWFGAHLWNKEHFLQDAHHLLMHQLYPDCATLPTCTGFKEIRYHQSLLSDEERCAYLDFLAQLLPQTAFIVLTRDLQQLSQSAWWKDQSQASVVATLQPFEATLKQHFAERQDVFWLTYQDMVERTPRLPALFEFLGAEWQTDKIAAVLSKPHSY